MWLKLIFHFWGSFSCFYCKAPICSAIAKGYEKLKDYYARTDKSEAYAIAISI